MLNSSSLVDGHHYSNTFHDIQKMRNISDELCRVHHLSVLEQRQNIGKSRKQYYHEKSLREFIKEDIDYAVSVSYTDKQFYNEVELLGYEIKITGKNIALKHPLHQKFNV